MNSITSYFKTPPASSTSEPAANKRTRSDDASPGGHEAKKLNLELDEAVADIGEDAPHWAQLMFKCMDALHAKMDNMHAIVEDFAEFKTVISKRMDDVERSAGFISDGYDKQQQDIVDMKQKLTDLEMENNLLRRAQLDLVTAVDSNEQRSRNECLMLHGIPEAVGETPTDTTAKFTQLVKESLEIELAPGAIVRSHRVGPPSADKTRPIIARFQLMSQRNRVYANKKKLKNSGKSISENLTRRRMKKLVEAKEKYGKTNVWSWEGRIFAKPEDGDKKITICS